jgi:hypothetical protein
MSHPDAMLRCVGGVEAFAATARTLGDVARSVGLTVPAFRSPPRIEGVARTIRRYPGGTVVSVRLRNRPLDSITADMVEGVIVTNHLGGDAALRARTLLTEAVAGFGSFVAATNPDCAVASGEARMVERQTRAA